ncbi:serine hydrolase domain-containing protein [Actinomadura atramentaria]|uniref:serine hydrolase domain-containing protein n=1 Tax=Actinomadura atramentaria TaxID=1990 RepID=UPI00036D57F3|nr:serine hydrolase [Actinomadura atramentaria]
MPFFRRLLATTTAVGALVAAVPGAARADDAPLPLPLLAHAPFYPTTTVQPADRPLALKRDTRALDVSYTYQGTKRTLKDFLNRSSTLGFLVLRGDTVVNEQYFSGYDAGSRFNSWSVGKSITSAAIGAAVADGKIRSVDDPVTAYVPELRGTGYDGVKIRDVLHMASGHDYDETNYFDPTKGSTATMIRMVFGAKLADQAKEGGRKEQPGTRWNYDSMNTFVLGWVVRKATGKSLASYVQDRIWRPAGMESAMQMGRDYSGSEIAFCCYHATVRDFGRFGLLYLRDGKGPDGRPVLPASWVRDSVTSTEPYLQPGSLVPDKPDDPENDFGYGYQWWLGNGGQGDYSAIGILGQFVYVSPRDGVVIVKTSQDLNSAAHQAESLYAFRAVADAVAH